ncbi:MAG: DUF4340 domain-containing protein [Lachnospiraceae bacterium]|nr:DUF4340 domain-containing protein [Lachnospiraceae bacterium]
MKKKKQIKTLIITLLALVLLVGGYVAMTLFMPKEEETEETQEDEVIHTVEEDTINKISYTNENGTIELVLNKEEWSSPTDKNCPVNKYTVDSMVTALQEVKASRTIEKADVDKKEFGLDKPSLVVDFTQKDGTKTTYTLGTLNSVVNKYYFQMSGDEKVYLIDTTMYNSFDYDLLKLAEVEEYPSMGGQDIADYTLTMDGKTLYFVDSKDAAHKKNEEEIPECVWEYGAKKNKLKKMDEDLASNVLQAIMGLTNAECVTYNLTDKDLKKCGLDKPKMSLTVHYTKMDQAEEEEEVNNTDDVKEEEKDAKIIDCEFTVYFGDTDSDSGEYYVQMKDSKAIYTMNVSGVNTLMSVFEQE